MPKEKKPLVKSPKIEKKPRPSPKKPVKTTRTHEENQERAYVAASRRSDRSLEARIESARRASEIHKNRTGRGLKVTEQDVANEEMYEEEEEDLPTQYQKLTAHLQSGSESFNRRLQNYMATNHGVRTLFLKNYANSPFSHLGQHPSMATPFVDPQMFSPQMFNQSPQALSQHQQQPCSPQAFQQPQPQAFQQPQSQAPHQPQPQAFQQPQPQAFQQSHHGYQQAPYPIPQRPNAHRRSTSITTPQEMPRFGPSAQHASPTVGTPQADRHQRMSVSPPALEQSTQTADGQSRPSLSRRSTSQNVQQHPMSPQHSHHSASATPPSGTTTPPSQLENTSAFVPFMPMNHTSSAQYPNTSPLSMSLPPELQQFVGSALDPNDPRTSIFMAGSENISQHSFSSGRYTYNPNFSPKHPHTASTATPSAAMSDSLLTPARTQTPPGEPLKVGTAIEGATSSNLPSAMSEGLFSDTMFSTMGFEFQSVNAHAFVNTSNEQGTQEEYDTNNFFNTADYYGDA